MGDLSFGRNYVIVIFLIVIDKVDGVKDWVVFFEVSGKSMYILFVGVMSSGRNIIFLRVLILILFQFISYGVNEYKLDESKQSIFLGSNGSNFNNQDDRVV